MNTGLRYRLTSDQENLRRRAGELAAEGVKRFGRHHDSWLNGYSNKFAVMLGKEGFIGLTWPTEHGGAGRPNIDRIIVSEELISAGAPLASYWVADRQMGPSIIKFGTETQQQQFLPGILSGTETWCIGMSEPDAGSDLAGVKTSVVDDGDQWVINGQKIWTSFAHRADYCYLVARTSTDGRRHEGVSEFIVPMETEGVQVRQITDLSSHRHFNEVFFDDVRIPKANLVGELGGAFSQTMRQLEHERGGIDRLVSNRPLYDDVLAVADRTDPLMRDEIARLETGYRIGRLLVYREATGQAQAGFSAATKTFCTEHEQRVAQFAARVLGPAAMIDNDTGRAIAYAPGYTIMGGTSNILRNILGERVLKLPREPR